MHKLHKKESREQPKIRLWLDSYDDLFSDFDPRPYSKRTLSDDFISQVRKVSREETGKNFALELLLPAPERNERHEEMIAQRLPEFFRKNYQQLVTERKQFRMKGLKFAGFGILLMVIGGYISYQDPTKFYVHLLLIIFEPAGWFLFWSGLDILLDYSGKMKKDMNFYSEMAETKIIFGSY
ncbi:hypothetical protein [Salinimicrobium soli]|uniref:hypothetical protein n=1 Tax=Salinimicrobium soli TaxID=1254399 RepID=UPI003AAD8C43